MSIKQLMRRAAVVMIARVAAGCQVGGANPSPAAPAGSQTGLASGGAQKLVVGYVALNATQLPSWVAKEQGIFDKNGWMSTCSISRVARAQPRPCCRVR